MRHFSNLFLKIVLFLTQISYFFIDLSIVLNFTQDSQKCFVEIEYSEKQTGLGKMNFLFFLKKNKLISKK